jgi:cystathionine beta-lyase/cystathionine gamma-synthase
MAAIATTVLALCRSGDRVVAARQVYGDTRDLLVRDLPRLGITVDLVDSTDLDQWRHELGRGPVRLVYAETMSNPALGLLDVPAVADLAHAAGAILVVDNTFASPALVRPLQLGADLVVESATKFLNGHSDVIAGAVAGDPETIREIRLRVVTLGGSLDPHAAYLLWRGLQTFELRVREQSRTAAELARWLSHRSDVAAVIHPSLPDHPQHELAACLMPDGLAGAIVTFVLDDDERALAVMNRLRVAAQATSLGGVETLVSTPFNSSHASLGADERVRAGIVPGMVRLSVGLEPVDAICADLAGALDAHAPEHQPVHSRADITDTDEGARP